MWFRQLFFVGSGIRLAVVVDGEKLSLLDNLLSGGEGCLTGGRGEMLSRRKTGVN